MNIEKRLDTTKVKRELGFPMNHAPNVVEEVKQPRKHAPAEKGESGNNFVLK